MLRTNDLESNITIEDKSDSYQDLFTLRTLSLPFLQNESVSQQFLIISNKKNEVFRWTYDEESLRHAYSIPMQEKEKGVFTKFFCEPRGYHTIFKHNKNIYYFHIKSNKIKELFKLKEINVESIGWDERCSELSTNQILIGSDNGNIYSYQIDYDPKTDTIKERLSHLIQLKLKTIYGIGFETYTLKNSEVLRYVVAVSDSQFYQFLGNPNFEVLFKKYKDNPKTLDGACKTFPEEGNSLIRSQLQLLYKDDYLMSFGWMTTAGFCYGQFGKDAFDTLIRNFIIVPYAKIRKDGIIETEDSPIAIAHSEYHIFLLFPDCISIISKITSNIVHTEHINDSLVNMTYDRFKNKLYIHSTKSLYQYVIENEDRDVWKAHLEKEDFHMALEHCKMKNLPYVRKVAKMYGNYLFNKGDYFNAAVIYAESDEKFEEVALKFLMCNEYKALKCIYMLIIVYLEIVDKLRFKDSDRTQKSLIATWLIEIHVNELNNCTDPSQKSQIQNNLTKLMKEKKDYLDSGTIYQLLQHYGRVNEFLEFAEIKKDYETVILHYINDKEIATGLQKLSLFIQNNEKTNELFNIFTKYSNIFMKYEPESTIDLLMNNFKNSIDPNKIISAIMNTDIKKREKVIDYLKILVNDPKMKDKNIHNLYIFFLSQIQTDASIKQLLYYLQKFVEDKKDQVWFEIEYALKIFSQFKIFSAQAWCLAIMGKYTEAIRIALDNNHVTIAKKIAKSVDDIKQKKNLWLEIFIHEIGRNKDNFNLALEAMNESEVLKIEDVLPHIMGSIKIEVFKKEITNCINKYENNIQELKKDISKYNKTAEDIKSDIYKVKKKQMEIKYKQCICEICNNTIKDDNIFLFPCGHLFDSNCIIEALIKYSSFIVGINQKMEKIHIMKGDIVLLEKRRTASKINFDGDDNTDRGTFFSNFMNFGFNENKQNNRNNLSISSGELSKLNELRNEFSNLLSEECVLCGDLMVESIKCPFEYHSDKSSWMIL